MLSVPIKNRIFPVFLLIISFFIFLIPSSSHGTPIAKQGVLDLSGWDLKKEGNLSFKGEWEFYWKQWVYNENSKKLNNPIFMKVPGKWKGVSTEGEKIGKNGYGSYKLKILLHEQQVGKPLALKMHYAHSAYVFYVNGEKTAENGNIGNTKESSIPWFKPGVIMFDSDSSQVELVFEVSNFHHGSGGLTRLIELGTADAIIAERESSLARDFFLLGTILLMGIYHLFVWSVRRREKSFLYFALFCLFASGYTIFTGERTFSMWWTYINWPLVAKITYLVGFIPFAFFVAYIGEVFKGDVSKKIIRFFFILVSLISVLIIVLPIQLAITVKGYAQFYVLATLIYILYIVIKALIKKRPGSLTVALGLLVFIVTVVHDILLSAHVLKDTDIAPFGVFFFFFSQSFLLSGNFAKAFTRVEEVSEALQQKTSELLHSNEKLKELDQLKDDFLANTSHELRTPLNGIIGLAEVMVETEKKQLEVSYRENLELIISSGKRLSNLINDVLDFSKLKNNQLEVNVKPIDMKVIVQTVRLLLQPLIVQKDLELQLDIPEKLPKVIGDENRVQQILFNLIGNAIKFTEKGVIIIQTELLDEQVTISVKDTGLGISEYQKQFIFKDFEQGSTEIAKKFSGTGLGLSISKKLVELLGSELKLESEVGKGSCFSFSLPVTTEESTEPVIFTDSSITDIMTAKLPAGDFNGDSFHILAVDDELVNQQVIQQFLTLHNYRITLASNGKEALKKLEDQKPDLVLMDIMMPDMSGFDVCKIIRKTYSAIELPVIFLSAKNQSNDLVTGLKLGGNDYISKPFSTEELHARIQIHLQLSELEKELLAINESLEQQVSDRTQELHQSNETLKEQFRELKNMQAQLIQSEKMSSLGTLIAGIAHEINNPAAYVLLGAGNLQRRLDEFQGFLSPLIDEDAPEEMVGHFNQSFQKMFKELTAVHEGIARIEGIVKGLKAFSRSSDAKKARVHLLNELENVVQLVIPQFKEYVSIDLNVPESVEIECFPGLMSQVYMNMLINASQSIREKWRQEPFAGKIEVTAEILPEERLSLSFKDNGLGIENDVINHIFEPFFTTKEPGEGSGLGLSISYGIIEQHHGTIQVDSTPESETVFHIQLPLYMVE